MVEWAQRERLYGITREQWEALFKSQGSCCAICHSTDPKTRLGWSTDHDHATGQVRGILCAKCNSLLGYLEQPIRPAAEAYLARTAVTGMNSPNAGIDLADVKLRRSYLGRGVVLVGCLECKQTQPVKCLDEGLLAKYQTAWAWFDGTKCLNCGVTLLKLP